MEKQNKPAPELKKTPKSETPEVPKVKSRAKRQVLATGTPVRTKPERGPGVLTYVGPDDVLIELEIKPGWIKVQIGEGKSPREGWIAERCFKAASI